MAHSYLRVNFYYSDHKLTVICFMIEEAYVWPGDLEIPLADPNINRIPPPLLLISFHIEESPNLSCLKVKNLDKSVLKSKRSRGREAGTMPFLLTPLFPLSCLLTILSHIPCDSSFLASAGRWRGDTWFTSWRRGSGGPSIPHTTSSSASAPSTSSRYLLPSISKTFWGSVMQNTWFLVVSPLTVLSLGLLSN